MDSWLLHFVLSLSLNLPVRALLLFQLLTRFQTVVHLKYKILFLFNRKATAKMCIACKGSHSLEGVLV